MSGWMQPPERRYLFSARCPGVEWWGAWCSLYPGSGREDNPYTSSYIQIILLIYGLHYPAGNGSMLAIEYEKVGTLYNAMLRVLMKLPLLSFKAMEEDDLWGKKEWDHTWHWNDMLGVLMYFPNPHIVTYTSTCVLLMRYSRG